jgi:hypothetical protein
MSVITVLREVSAGVGAPLCVGFELVSTSELGRSTGDSMGTFLVTSVEPFVA